ncbi:MAG: hypothetical protein KBA74_06840 [Prevotella sp.]|nr:hypothetical protein [Prevotella sp.]MBP7098383.1 hypothetical protein [Prevotella sp.]MBP8687208.1 hypothetical protein [Prevotella sp.]
MVHSFGYFIFILIAIVIGIITVKKVTGCLIKAIIGVVLIGILVLLYFLYFS